jgi:hypothetical protein
MEETAGPGEGDMLCAISPALPILSVCSQIMSVASGSPLMSRMTILLTLLDRRRLHGRGQEAVREGSGEDSSHLAGIGPAWSVRCGRMRANGSRPTSAEIDNNAEPVERISEA